MPMMIPMQANNQKNPPLTLLLGAMIEFPVCLHPTQVPLPSVKYSVLAVTRLVIANAILIAPKMQKITLGTRKEENLKTFPGVVVCKLEWCVSWSGVLVGVEAIKHV